jgi:hypothetical protein
MRDASLPCSLRTTTRAVQYLDLGGDSLVLGSVYLGRGGGGNKPSPKKEYAAK